MTDRIPTKKLTACRSWSEACRVLCYQPIFQPMRLEYLSEKLTSPIPTKDGSTLRTIQEGCEYMARLPTPNVALIIVLGIRRSI
jgi:hypothetical protein